MKVKYDSAREGNFEKETKDLEIDRIKLIKVWRSELQIRNREKHHVSRIFWRTYNISKQLSIIIINIHVSFLVGGCV